MEQIEFKNLENIKDGKHPLAELYKLEDKYYFYIEPNFYSQLSYLKERYYDRFDEIMEELIANVKRNKKVVFTADYDNPVVYEDDYIYQEIEDILNPLKIVTDYTSCGSDYGD